MVRRVIGVIVGSVALATALSGCLLPLDSSGADMQFWNKSSQDVVVIVEGFSSEFPQLVASQISYPFGLDDCEGTGIRVETKSGELIGRVNKQACPNWTLTINEDGTLDYVADE